MKAALKHAAMVMRKYKVSIDDVIRDFGLKKEELLAYLKNEKEKQAQ